jgi:hypothetical protein
MNRFLHVLAFASIVPVVACGGEAPPPATPAAASQTRAPLDGTSYEVSLEYPGEAPVKDVLTFDSGRFESSACTSFGFPKWTDYRAEKTGAAIAFHVETHHPKGTVVEWEGTIEGGTASGKTKRTMDGKSDTGTFRGPAR